MIRVRQIKLSLEDDNINKLKEKVLKKLNIKEKDLIDFSITKRSIDARDDIKVVYEVELNTNKKVKLGKDIIEFKKINYSFPKPNKKVLNRKVLIVGAGPAGLFSAYFLAKNGMKPTIIDRGKKIDERVKDVDLFFNKGILNEESNILYGEGGAGTFSDGKLTTLVKDKKGLIKEVLKIFVSCGAPKEILYEKNPHIGTDLLRNVIINLRKTIENYGGVFKYNNCLNDIIIENNIVKKVIINEKEEYYDDIILAIGHSPKDTYEMLYRNGINLTNKPFAVGLRIMTKQDIINKNQYGKYYKMLPPASYKLTYTTKSKRGVYTFCMCPGGYVINSSNEKEFLVINGMSNHKRDSLFANSAVLVTVNNKDYGDKPLDGLYFIKDLEKKAYNLGKGSIPVQNYKDYLTNSTNELIMNIDSGVKGTYKISNLNNIFPLYINESLKEGLKYFCTKIDGFENSVLLGVESRSSSPIRILRDESYLSNIKNIYPIGEGSGYSGGITTSSIDGIIASEKLIINNNNK